MLVKTIVRSLADIRSWSRRYPNPPHGWKHEH